MHIIAHRKTALVCVLAFTLISGCKHIPRGDSTLPHRNHDFAQKSTNLAPYIELDNGISISMPENYEERFVLVQKTLKAHIQTSPPAWVVGILAHDAQGDGHTRADAKAYETADPTAATPHTGYAPAQDLLARMYLEGDGVKQNSAKAFNLALSAARQGHTQAQVLVATLYTLGHGVTQNAEQAFFWAREAAHAKDPQAMAMLADAYRQGLGTPQDDQEAFIWTRKASQAGVLRAHVWLGLYYHAMRRLGR